MNKVEENDVVKVLDFVKELSKGDPRYELGYAVYLLCAAAACLSSNREIFVENCRSAWTDVNQPTTGSVQ